MIQIQLKRDGFGKSFWSATGEHGDFFCHKCYKGLTEGYICESDKQNVKCKKCQSLDNMRICKHDDIGEHRHMKFIVSNEAKPELNNKGVTSSNE